MMSAAVVYWYPATAMRLDGGGLRVQAWADALTQLGYAVKIHGLWSIGGGVSRGDRLSAIKRAVVPMPFSRGMPENSLGADLTIATVPAVFADAIRKVPPDRLVLDWMDLWSVAAKNMGTSRWTSIFGGITQSQLWRHRERTWTGMGQANVYAGHEDYLRMLPRTSGPASWIPTPVDYRGRQQHGNATNRLGFLGNLDYPPNEKSLRQFLDRHLRQIRDQRWELVVAGFGSHKVASWGYPITVLGEVDDLAKFYSSISAAVVPINHGGGIKVKAVEALSFGVPVLTTAHVRSGFSAAFHPYLPDISDIDRGLDRLEIKQIPAELFETTFSADAFAREVQQVLSR